MAEDLPLSPALRKRIDQVLRPGEHLLWIGQPNAWFMVLREAVPSGCSFIALTVGGGLLLLVAMLVGISIGELLIPITVASALCWLLLLNPYWARWRALRTAYVVTDQRAMIVRAGLGGRTDSLWPEQLGTVKARQLPDGHGEIVFREEIRSSFSSSADGLSSSERRTVHVVGFLEVDQVDGPRQALEKLLGRPVPVEQVTTLSASSKHSL